MTLGKFDICRTTALRLALCIPLLPACADKPAGKAEIHASATENAEPPTTAPPAAPPAPPRVEEDLSIRLRREVDGAAHVDPDDSNRVSQIHPVLKCVETSSKGEWRAHFGYRNKTREAVPIAIGLHNRVWPPPIGQGQPTAFQPGGQADVLQLPFVESGEVAWVLGQSFEIAKTGSRRCTGATDSEDLHGAQEASLICKPH